MTRPARDEGFILVIVLLMMMALASLASAYSVYAGQAAMETLVPEDRLRGEAAVRAGLSLAVAQLLETAGPLRPSHGGFEARVGGTPVRVVFRAENARIDLNAATQQWLAGLFAKLGWPDAAAAKFAERVVAWRSIGAPNVANPELAAYRAAGLPYPPKQAPFESVDELGLVMGLPPDLPSRAAPYLTVYNGPAGVNVAEADPLVLAAWPEITPATLASLLKARASGADGKTLVTLLGSLGDSAAEKPDQAFRAKIEVRLRNRTLHAEIVFSLQSDALNAYEILDWRDDFDGFSFG